MLNMPKIWPNTIVSSHSCGNVNATLNLSPKVIASYQFLFNVKISETGGGRDWVFLAGEGLGPGMSGSQKKNYRPNKRNNENFVDHFTISSTPKKETHCSKAEGFHLPNSYSLGSQICMYVSSEFIHVSLNWRHLFGFVLFYMCIKRVTYS